MAVMNKATGLFFYASGVIILLLNFFLMQPTYAKAVNTSNIITEPFFALIQFFYALGVAFVFLGIFLFAISSFYGDEKNNYG